MTKIVHMSSVHPATDVRIFHKESRALAQAGYEVTLIARGEQNQVIDNVQIRALHSTVENRVRRMTKTVMDVYRLAVAENAALYHFHDPELIPVGMMLKAQGKRVIYDVHENVPKDMLSKAWIPRPLRRPMSVAANVLLKWTSRILDAVVVATPGIANVFPESRVTLVQNYPLLAELSIVGKSELAQRPTDVVYTGGISDLRGIRQMVKAVEYLNDATPVRLKLGGRIMPQSLEAELVKEPGWKYVDMLGWLGRPEVLTLFGRVRVGLVLFQPAPNHIESQPNKLFEYMAAGLPVVASNFPLWKKLVTELECGIVVDPRDPQAIADAVQWLLDHPEEAHSMGQRGRQAVLERYNWEAESGKLLALYESLVGPPRVQRV